MARNYRRTAVQVAFFTWLMLSAVCEMRAADPDQPKIQGSWELIGAERNGMRVPDEEVKNRPLKVVFEGDAFIPEEGTNKAADSNKGTFKLDSTKSPKEIDITRNDEQRKEKIIGIYELDGDDLKLCIVPIRGDTPADRPKEMKSSEKSMMLILKRLKK